MCDDDLVVVYSDQQVEFLLHVPVHIHWELGEKEAEVEVADDLLAVAPEAPQLVGARGVTVGYEFADDFVVVVHGGACLVIGNGLVAPGMA